jgi:hypothetical protein
MLPDERGKRGLNEGMKRKPIVGRMRLAARRALSKQVNGEGDKHE